MKTLGIRYLFGTVLVASLVGFQRECTGANPPDFGTRGKQLANAVTAEDAGDFEEAVELYKRFIKKYDGVPAGYYYLGNLYHDAGKTTEAAEIYEKARLACPG